MGEGAGLADELFGYGLGEGRAEDLQTVVTACALVPAAEKEAGIVDVMVEVVVGEEQVVDLSRPEADLDQLVSGGGAAVKHEVLAVDLDYE